MRRNIGRRCGKTGGVDVILQDLRRVSAMINASGWPEKFERTASGRVEIPTDIISGTRAYFFVARGTIFLCQSTQFM
jgi:hypothetical protein